MLGGGKGVVYFCVAVCEEGPGICSLLLTLGALLLIVASLPISLVLVIKVVQVLKNDCTIKNIPISGI